MKVRRWGNESILKLIVLVKIPSKLVFYFVVQWRESTNEVWLVENILYIYIIFFLISQILERIFILHPKWHCLITSNGTLLKILLYQFWVVCAISLDIIQLVLFRVVAFYIYFVKVNDSSIYSKIFLFSVHCVPGTVLGAG